MVRIFMYCVKMASKASSLWIMAPNTKGCEKKKRIRREDVGVGGCVRDREGGSGGISFDTSSNHVQTHFDPFQPAECF